MLANEDLLRAAQIMNERGKCEGDCVSPSGQVCMLGAIGMATIEGYEHQIRESGSWWPLKRSRRAMAAIEALAAYLDPFEDDTTLNTFSVVYGRNDKTIGWGKKGRTVRLLEKAARNGQ